MKNIKLLAVFAIVALMLTVSAVAAVTVTYDIEEVTAENGTECYAFVATLNDTDGDFRGFSTTLTFDGDIFKPISKKTAKALDLSSGSSTLKTPFLCYYYMDEETEEESEAAVADAAWTVDANGMVTVAVDTSLTPNKCPATDCTALALYFVYADDKSAEDITDDSFAVNKITYTNGIFNYYGRDDEGRATNITLVNNVVPEAPAERKIAKIPVSAGNTVYEYAADNSYTVTEIAADGTYNVLVPENEGVTVIVNNGYTAQKVYRVSTTEDGYYKEDELVENGVLGSTDVSMRVVDPQGIRFFGSIANKICSAGCSEYGFIMTVESAYNNLPEDYVLDMELVEAGKAKKGVAYNGNGTDVYFSRDVDATVIAGVLYGVPKTAEGVQTVIVSRPYYEVNGAYVYGEETSASLYEIAKNIYNVEGYEVAWDYAKEVIELVEGDIDEPELPELENEIVIDVSFLYE